jgi:hypothetical protein
MKKLREKGMETARKPNGRKGTYEGQYVALDPATGDKVIAHGSRSDRVAAEARRAGVKVPMIIYVPERDTACLY